MHLGLDEGAGVNDLDIFGLVHHHSLVVLVLPLHLHKVGHLVLVCLLDSVHPLVWVVFDQLYRQMSFDIISQMFCNIFHFITCICHVWLSIFS